MTDMPAEAMAKVMQGHGHSPGVVLRSVVIGLTAFLTVVDLFATQAILPTLTRHYGVTPGAMGFAVNASTIGMAVAGLVVGSFSPHIDRRMGILASLLLLAVLCDQSRVVTHVDEGIDVYLQGEQGAAHIHRTHLAEPLRRGPFQGNVVQEPGREGADRRGPKQIARECRNDSGASVH